MTFTPSEVPADWVSWGLDSSSPCSQRRACGLPLPDLQHRFLHSISSDSCSNLGPYSLSGCLCQSCCDTACWSTTYPSINCKAILKWSSLQFLKQQRLQNNVSGKIVFCREQVYVLCTWQVLYICWEYTSTFCSACKVDRAEGTKVVIGKVM